MCICGEPRNFICLAAVSRGIYQIARGICQISAETVGPTYHTIAIENVHINLPQATMMRVLLRCPYSVLRCPLVLALSLCHSGPVVQQPQRLTLRGRP